MTKTADIRQGEAAVGSRGPLPTVKTGHIPRKHRKTKQPHYITIFSVQNIAETIMSCLQQITLVALVAALCLGATLAARMPRRICSVAMASDPNTPIFSWLNQCDVDAGETCSLDVTAGQLVLSYCDKAEEAAAQEDQGANDDSMETYACAIQSIEAGVPVVQDGVTCPQGVSCDLGPVVLTTVDGDKFLTFCSEPQAPGEPMPFRGVLARACAVNRVGEAALLLEQPCEAGVQCGLGPLVASFDGSLVEAIFCDVTGEGSMGSSAADGETSMSVDSSVGGPDSSVRR